jgi:CxxC-x17-CxxC domain-containing protein
MYTVDEKCAECGTAITQLPFQPTGGRPVYCTNCLRNRRGDSPRGNGGGFNRAPRQMYDVDLSCAQCGTHISQLPFQPSGDRPVYCMDCNRARRASGDMN